MDTFKIAESVRNEYCLKVIGNIRPRPEGTVNENLASGTIEVVCQNVEILNTSATPPFMIDD